MVYTPITKNVGIAATVSTVTIYYRVRAVSNAAALYFFAASEVFFFSPLREQLFCTLADWSVKQKHSKLTRRC